MLTLSQTKTYRFIKQFFAENNYAPTMAEIAKGIGIKSRGVVHRYVHALADEGLVKLIPHRRRNIQLLPEASDTSSPFIDLGGSSWKLPSLPLLGSIAAGEPIEAVAQPESIDFASLLLGDDRFALRVKGDSMIEEGIFDGDYVVCQQSATADNGQIVVALIDQQEATLKRLQNNRDRTVTLLPANARLSPMVYDAERVCIQGVFVGLLRLPH